MGGNPLGQATIYRPQYDKSLLFPIERSLAREAAGIQPANFSGFDVWHSHELGWLNSKGLPQVARLRLIYPSTSPRIIESKSLKLYLVSFIMTRFPDSETVRKTIEADLQEALGCPQLTAELIAADEPITFEQTNNAVLLDTLDISCDEYEVNPSLLQKEAADTNKPITYLSHLLKTNCPITGQPDWATVKITAGGKEKLRPETLLAYLVSYREHGDYHEACCEKIYTDIYSFLKPEYLAVECFFTRRGGIDINPCRYSKLPDQFNATRRFWRQ